MGSKSWDYIAKIVMIGDSACGKSSLTIRLTDDRFSQIHDVTIAAEIGSKTVQVGDKNEHMRLQIWDTAGQEHFRAVTRSYFRNAAGCLLVYDVTRRSTFLHAKDWLEDILSQSDDNISICLVGNKTDLIEEENEAQAAGTQPKINPIKREVTFEEAQKWAEENNLFTFVETSAKTGDNVVEAYSRVANDIYQKIVSGKFDLNDRSHGIKASAHKNNGNISTLTLDSANQNRSKSEGSCC